VWERELSREGLTAEAWTEADGPRRGFLLVELGIRELVEPMASVIL
jgi:hypothetical protein